MLGSHLTNVTMGTVYFSSVIKYRPIAATFNELQKPLLATTLPFTNISYAYGSLISFRILTELSVAQLENLKNKQN